MPRIVSLPVISSEKISKILLLRWLVALGVLVCVLIAAGALGIYAYFQQSDNLNYAQAENSKLQQELDATKTKLDATQASLSALLNEDQLQRNEQLQAEIDSIEKTFSAAVKSYEALLDLGTNINQYRVSYQKLGEVLSFLSDQNYASASAGLVQLDAEIAKHQVVTVPIAANVPSIQEAPSSGYRRQSVTTEFGTYQVDVVAADLNSTRVQVETASESTCADNCPVASLAEFIARSGGFAGINGPYFCPAEYPSCAGKTNSFDTLLMNKHKTYFNSDNNVYSSVPAVIFTGNSARFVSQSSQWGRDTGVDAVIAAQPMLLQGGNVTFGGDGDPKKGSVGSRSFIGTKDSTVYIGVVRGATVAEVAHVLKAMGLQNALNLDSGGSTAFSVDGRHIAGPGRNTPFGIVLVRK